VYQLLPSRRTAPPLALAGGDRADRVRRRLHRRLPPRRLRDQYSVPMHGTSGLAASAKIQIGKRDSHGNWPLRFE
jgi:hypothetical protein